MVYYIDRIAEVIMYHYYFDIYFKDYYNGQYMVIFMDAKDKFSPYENIMIQVHDEKYEDCCSSIEASCMKEEPYSGEFFFKWLSRQSLFDYGDGRINLSCFSPYELFRVVDKSDRFRIDAHSEDDPEGFDDDDLGSYFKKVNKNHPSDVVF